MSKQDEARDRLLKAVDHFLKTEVLLVGSSKSSIAEMKKRTDYFVDKIVEMKKHLK